MNQLTQRSRLYKYDDNCILVQLNAKQTSLISQYNSLQGDERGNTAESRLKTSTFTSTSVNLTSSSHFRVGNAEMAVPTRHLWKSK